MIDKILADLIASVAGARAAVLLDGDGEYIAQAGDATIDVRLIGAWKEIQLDRIKDIAGRLGLGKVRAVLFSVSEGNELVVPVMDDYCLLLFMSPYANIREAISKAGDATEQLVQDMV